MRARFVREQTHDVASGSLPTWSKRSDTGRDVRRGVRRAVGWASGQRRVVGYHHTSSADAPPRRHADVAQLVERDLPKVDVASSSLVIRSDTRGLRPGRYPRPGERVHRVPRGRPRLLRRPRDGQHQVLLGGPQVGVDGVGADADDRTHRRPRRGVREPKVFRPYRDVRFAKDKTPYKTHQGAFVGTAPATGWYVEVSARGVRAGGGFYDAVGADLARIRESIAHEATGEQLQRILRALETSGLHDRWRPAQDRAARVRRGPPPNRTAAVQVAHRDARPRVRPGDPHAGPARRRTRGLARVAAPRRVGHRPGGRLSGLGEPVTRACARWRGCARPPSAPAST